MDAMDLFRLISRQRRIAVVLALLVAGFSVVAALGVPTQFSSSATVLTLRTGGTGVNSNPIAQTDPAYVQAATLVVTVLQSPAVTETLKSDLKLDELTVTNESGPVLDRTAFIEVDVTASTAVGATSAARAVLTRASNALRDQQRGLGVPDEQQMTLIDVVPPGTEVAGHGMQFRAVAVTVALGLMLLMLVLVLVDRLDAVRIREDVGRLLRFLGPGSSRPVHDPMLDELERSLESSHDRPSPVPRPRRSRDETDEGDSPSPVDVPGPTDRSGATDLSGPNDVLARSNGSG